jgi:hypothetical protein
MGVVEQIKIFSPAGNWSQVFQPVASHLTEWAISADIGYSKVQFELQTLCEESSVKVVRTVSKIWWWFLWDSESVNQSSTVFQDGKQCIYLWQSSQNFVTIYDTKSPTPRTKLFCRKCHKQLHLHYCITCSDDCQMFRVMNNRAAETNFHIPKKNCL